MHTKGNYWKKIGTWHNLTYELWSGIYFPGEKELVEFLAEEIVVERKAGKSKKIPSEIDGFKVKFEGAEVELTKQSDKEK